MVNFVIRYTGRNGLNIRYISLRIIRHTNYQNSSKYERMLPNGVSLTDGTADFCKTRRACASPEQLRRRSVRKSIAHTETHHCEIGLTLTGCSVHRSGLIPGAKSQWNLWPLEKGCILLKKLLIISILLLNINKNRIIFCVFSLQISSRPV